MLLCYYKELQCIHLPIVLICLIITSNALNVLSLIANFLHVVDLCLNFKVAALSPAPNPFYQIMVLTYCLINKVYVFITKCYMNC